MSFDPTIQGTKNYIESRDGTKLGLWTAYANAAGSSPVDGTGGSPASTFVAQTDSAIRKNTNFLWTKTAVNRQGEGFSYAFSIDNADKGKVLQCSFEYQIASGTFADNDMSVWVYDVTNAVLIQPAPYLIKNSGVIEKFAVEFQTASNSNSYRLIIHTGSTSASAYTIKFDNFMLGPEAKLYGSAITDWISYTPNLSTVGILSSNGYWRRTGDSIEIEGRMEFNGAGSASTLTVGVPSGVTIDTTKIVSLSTSSVGVGYWSDSGTGFFTLLARSNTSTTFSFYQQAGTASFNTTVCASGDVITFNVKLPVTGWSSSQVFSQDADTRVVAAQAYAATISSTATGSPIIFPTVGADTHSAYNSTTGLYTAPVSGYYQANVEIALGTFASGNYTYISVNGNTTPGANRPVVAWSVVANGAMSGSGIVFVNAGQTISIRATATLTSSDPSNLSIYRLSGPAQIAASESVAALYTGAPPTGTFNSSFNTVTYGTKVKDSHNAYSGGVYTIPTSGVYDISAQLLTLTTLTAGEVVQLGVSINGAAPTYKTYYNATASASNALVPFNVQSIPLLAGSTVAIQALTEGTTNSFSSNAGNSYFSITRTGNY